MATPTVWRCSTKKLFPDYEAALKVNPQDNDTFQRLQYAQSMLAKKNASPPPAASIATPTPSPSLIVRSNRFTRNRHRRADHHCCRALAHTGNPKGLAA